MTSPRTRRDDAYSANAALGESHITALANALAKFGKATRMALVASTRAGNAGTRDLFTGVLRDVDELLRVVEANVQAKS